MSPNTEFMLLIAGGVVIGLAANRIFCRVYGRLLEKARRVKVWYKRSRR